MKTFPQSIRELSGLPFSDSVMAVSLSAGSAETIVVPSGAAYVLLSGSADFYAKPNGTATVPGDTIDGTASELNPTMRSLSGVIGISVISAGSCIVTASFYGP